MLLVFNIQKYSLHDGSGIRTVVFLKGCPLRCGWCSNPESQRCEKELMYRKTRCLGKDICGLCADTAPDRAVTFDEEGKAAVDFSLVTGNLSWTDVCPAKALETEGKEYAVDEILDIVESDAAFYRRGDGGMTVSGGEPLLQEQTVLLLQKAKERYLHTSIETCGFVKQERLLSAAPFLDQIFFDIKSMNDEKHREHTGVSGQPIRENLCALCTAFPEKPVTVRTPVIPGFNDGEEELRKIEEFLCTLPSVRWERLPYHEYGVPKYEMLGRKARRYGEMREM